MSDDARFPPSDLPSLSTGLLQRVQEMQPEGWGRLVEVFGPIVYRWCRQSGLPGHDAADVVQDVFASVARGIGGFRRTKPEGSFRSWLATITRNRVRDHIRRLKKQPDAIGGTDALQRVQNLADPLEESISGVDLEVALSQRVTQLLQCEFEQRTWQAFWSTTVDGRSPADVADQLDMSLAAVYQAKSRVLRRLRQRLAELPR